MILQIVNGTIDASWLLGISWVIIGFFLVRTLIRMEKKQNVHDAQIRNLTIIQIKMLSRLGVDDNFYNDLLNKMETE